MKKRLTRRHFLRGLGGVAIGLPMLDAMVFRTPSAAGADIYGPDGRPKRFVTLFVPNGTLESEWYPQGSETNFTLGPMMLGPDPSNPRRSLAPHKNDLLILRGVDNYATQREHQCTHNDIATVMTGHPIVGPDINSVSTGGPSIDQVIAAKIDSIVPLRKTSIQIGGGGGSGNRPSWMSHAGPNQPMPRIEQPQQLFVELFGDGTMDADAAERLWMRRKSILDGLKSEYDGILPRVSAADRPRLEAHLESIRTVERQLSVIVSCNPENPQHPNYEGGLYTQWLPDMAPALLDLLLLAFACDVTRVATIELRPAGGGASYFPWLGLPTAYDDGEHHELTHDPNNPDKRQRLRIIWQYFHEFFATLIQRLKETSEGSGTLFDNSLLMEVSECADGAYHSKNSLPFLLAGSAGGVFRTGRYLQYPGVPHNNLMLSIANAFGVEASTFGLPELCTGELGGLT